MHKIAPFLWFDDKAEQAAKFYTSIFKNSKICDITLYGNEGYEIHGRKAGSVATVEFEIEGQEFVALNGGPLFKFNEAISFQVYCETQEEVDYYWQKLSEGGDKKGAAMRLAQGQIRGLMANRSHSFDHDAKRQGYTEIG